MQARMLRGDIDVPSPGIKICGKEGAEMLSWWFLFAPVAWLGLGFD